MNRKSQESTQLLYPGGDSDPGLQESGGLLGTEHSQRTLDRVQLFWDARGSLARFAGFGLFLSILVAFIVPPTYESTTRLMPPQSESEGITMIAALAGKAGDSPLGAAAGDMLGIKSSGPLFVGLLRSRTVEDALIQRFDLRNVYRTRRWDAARKVLESRTVVWEDRKSGIIEARVRDRSPQRAQALARAYVDELDRAVNKLTTSAARREREFLEARLVGIKGDLDQASKNFSQFASQNTAIDIPAQGKAMVEAAAVLQGQLMAAEAEEQGLKQIYTSNNVRVRSLDSRIAELRRQLDLLGKAGTGQGSEGKTDSENSIYPSIRKLPILGVTYFDLYRQARIQEALYEALTQRYEFAKVQEAKEIPTVRLLDAADLPENKTTPQRTLIAFLGLVFSFGLGCAWILGNAKWAEMDSDDSRKVFIMRVSADLRRDWTRLLAAAKITSTAKRKPPLE